MGTSVEFQPELIKLIKSVLNDAAATLPIAKRTPEIMVRMASQILACAAKGERDPATLMIAAVLAATDRSLDLRDVWLKQQQRKENASTDTGDAVQECYR
jgi:hypothetical protein